MLQRFMCALVAIAAQQTLAIQIQDCNVNHHWIYVYTDNGDTRVTDLVGTWPNRQILVARNIPSNIALANDEGQVDRTDINVMTNDDGQLVGSVRSKIDGAPGRFTDTAVFSNQKGNVYGQLTCSPKLHYVDSLFRELNTGELFSLKMQIPRALSSHSKMLLDQKLCYLGNVKAAAEEFSSVEGSNISNLKVEENSVIYEYGDGKVGKISECQPES